MTERLPMRMSVYLPRDNQVVWNAQAKRGLVKKVSGTEV